MFLARNARNIYSGMIEVFRNYIKIYRANVL